MHTVLQNELAHRNLGERYCLSMVTESRDCLLEQRYVLCSEACSRILGRHLSLLLESLEWNGRKNFNFYPSSIQIFIHSYAHAYSIIFLLTEWEVCKEGYFALGVCISLSLSLSLSLYIYIYIFPFLELRLMGERYLPYQAFLA